MPTLAFDADPDTGLPPLLMVHGLMVDRRIWNPNAGLSDQFRCIRVDLPAHGQSPVPEDSDDTTPTRIVTALDDLRRDLGIARWHVCGQSFGGALVLRYALDFPDHCHKVVFTNANAALRGTFDVATHEALVSDIRAQGRAALRRTAYHPIRARRFPPDLRDALVAGADTVDPQGFANLLAGAMPTLSVHHRLGTLHVPTMLVNGVKERKFQPTRDWLAQTHPAIRIVDLEGGHSVNVESPDGFNAAVRAFLAP
jgi:pimeloyl-ACP methyl ester carboxylesterase